MKIKLDITLSREWESNKSWGECRPQIQKNKIFKKKKLILKTSEMS